MSDVKTALMATWVVASTVLFILALAPFIVPAEWLFRVSPVCEAKRRGGSCVLCGMTTAYAAIGQSRFREAKQSNAGALPLWGGSLLNFSTAATYVAIALHKRRRR